MLSVGVDLAWGTNATTGLAVVDESGELLEVATGHEDDEVVGWLERWTTRPCLVAIDAPLVVTNPSGRRGCEELVGRYFGQFNAYCHSSNTSNPAFADGGRAARIARRLGLDADPGSTADRRAVEVYPHPAIVVFFGLPTVIRYKAKRRRSFGFLQSEMLRLVGYMVNLAMAEVPLRVSTNPGWRNIHAEVEQATRKSQLRRVEDMIDAVVCAYIAAFASARPSEVRTLGNAHEGYILTPVTTAIAQQIDAAGPAKI